MQKLWILVKVDLKRMFKTNKSKTNLLNKIIISVILTAILMLTVGMYVFGGLTYLKPLGLEKYIIALVYFLCSFMIFYTTIYRSKAYLFNTDDIIFSMPIKSSTILTSKVISIIFISYLNTFLVCIPAFLIYGLVLNLGAIYYIMAIIATIFLPFVPTVLGSIFGYLIGYFTSKVKSKRIFETLFTYFLTFGLMYLSFNLQNILPKILQNMDVVDNLLNTIGILIKSLMIFVTEYNVLHMFIYILVNVISIFIFVAILQHSYVKIVQNLKVVKNSSKKYIEKVHNKKSKFMTLFIREIKQYFSIPIYVFNTSIGVIIILISSISTLFIDSQTIYKILEVTSGEFSMFMLALPVIGFVILMTNTSSVSISIEGKTFWMLKELPIKVETVFLSKILFNVLLILPVSIISILIATFTLKFTIIQTLLLILLSIVVSIFCSMFGIIANLKYPSLNFISYTYVVKQSFSAFLGMMLPMMLFIVALSLYFVIGVEINTYVLLVISLLLVIIMLQYVILKKWGIKKFNELN
ncbi:MAG: hypothetical protein RR290_01680 [Clostridia bacterium]